MNIEEIRALDDAALKSTLVSLYKKRIHMQLKRVTGGVPKIHEWKILRKSIARVLTIMGQRGESANV